MGFAVASLVAAAPAAPAIALASESTDYAGVRATLSREIPKEMGAGHVVGLSVALVEGERTVWARGFGWADRATRAPVTADTLFHIGSTSKTLTAAAVMQLVEQGRVDLEAPLSRYVPQYKMLPRFPGSVVTVRSVVTGEDFVSYTRRHLFGPMGMDNTTFEDTSPSYSELAHGYQEVTGSNGCREGGVTTAGIRQRLGDGIGRLLSGRNSGVSEDGDRGRGRPRR